MQAPTLFSVAWSMVVEASLLALGERGTAAFALLMSVFCGLVAVYVFLKSASTVVDIVWGLVRVALAVFLLLALLNALAPSLHTTLFHLAEAALGRKALLV